MLASEPETLTGFWLQSGPAVEAVDPMSSMPSRAAENLFWLGRYAERAEALARLLRAVHDRRNDFQGSANRAGIAALRGLLVALTDGQHDLPGLRRRGSQERLDAPGAELLDLVVDDQPAGDAGPRRAGTARRRARGARPAVARHVARRRATRATISELGWTEPTRTPRRQTALRQVMQSLLALGGLGSESMVRDLGWRFMDAGRRLERGIQLLVAAARDGRPRPAAPPPTASCSSRC